MQVFNYRFSLAAFKDSSLPFQGTIHYETPDKADYQRHKAYLALA